MDRIEKIVKRFERNYVAEEQIKHMIPEINQELKNRLYLRRKREARSIEEAKKIYITC